MRDKSHPDAKPRWTARPVTLHAVQCARCLKWRIVPTKEHYEPIREHILENPWACEDAVKWRPDVSCELPADIEQDESMLWAIDKPNLPAAPTGWERQITVRTDGSSKFADVYYTSPRGTRLRSKVEIERHISKYPDSVPPDTTMNQFSFAIPRPLPGVCPHLTEEGKLLTPTPQQQQQMVEQSGTSEQITIQSADSSSMQGYHVVPTPNLEHTFPGKPVEALDFFAHPGTPLPGKRQHSASTTPSYKRTKQQIKQDRRGADGSLSSSEQQLPGAFFG